MEFMQMITTNNCYVGQNNPEYIVIHETDNTSYGAGAIKHATALKNGNLSTSVHYFVDDSYVVQVLEHKNAAWAVGTIYKDSPDSFINNRNSINIEICVNPDSNYDAAVINAQNLCAELLTSNKWPISRLSNHNRAKGKYCPRNILNNGSWSGFVHEVEINMSIMSSLSKQGWYGNQYFIDGQCLSNQWLKYCDSWYYFDVDGVSIGGWVKYGGKVYFCDRERGMLVGWQNIQSNTYYFNEVTDTGEMLSNCIIEDESGLYYLDKEGKLQIDCNITLNAEPEKGILFFSDKKPVTYFNAMKAR